VWDSVDEMLNERRMSSATGAAAAVEGVYERDGGRRRAASELARRGPLPGQCGVAITAGGWVTAVEVFGSPELLAAHWESLVRSHLVEPVRPRDGAPSATKVLKILRRLAHLPAHASAPGVGLGTELRGSDRWITGQALLLNDAPVHATAFAV